MQRANREWLRCHCGAEFKDCQDREVTRHRERGDKRSRVPTPPVPPPLNKTENHASDHGDQAVSGKFAGKHQRPACPDASEADETPEAEAIAICMPAQRRYRPGAVASPLCAFICDRPLPEGS